MFQFGGVRGALFGELSSQKTRVATGLMISRAVFIAAVAPQNEFPLSSKFSRNPGSMSKTYGLHMFCRPREIIWRDSSCKALGGVVGSGSTVLTGASCWPSSNCIPDQKIVSLSTELTHNRSALVLDSDSGVCCHHSSS